MKDLWLVPIVDNVKFNKFSKFQHHILKSFIIHLGFVLYSPRIEDWYILNNDTELFLHHNSVHLICHIGRNNHQTLQELANLFLIRFQFLRLDNDEL